MTMKTWRQHNCTRQHRTYNKLARCMVPHAEWVTGEGPYAVISWCTVPTIRLRQTIAEAETARERIDLTGCCGEGCTHRHDLVVIVR